MFEKTKKAARLRDEENGFPIKPKGGRKSRDFYAHTPVGGLCFYCRRQCNTLLISEYAEGSVLLHKECEYDHTQKSIAQKLPKFKTVNAESSIHMGQLAAEHAPSRRDRVKELDRSRSDHARSFPTGQGEQTEMFIGSRCGVASDDHKQH